MMHSGRVSATFNSRVATIWPEVNSTNCERGLATVGSEDDDVGGSVGEKEEEDGGG